MGKKKLPPIPERDEFMKHFTLAMLDEYESMDFDDDSEFAWAWNDDMTSPVAVWRETGEPATNKNGNWYNGLEPFSLSDPLMSQIGTKWPTMTEQMRVFVTGDPKMASTRLSPPPKGQAANGYLPVSLFSSGRLRGGFSITCPADSAGLSHI